MLEKIKHKINNYKQFRKIKKSYKDPIQQRINMLLLLFSRKYHFCFATNKKSFFDTNHIHLEYPYFLILKNKKDFIIYKEHNGGLTYWEDDV